MEKDVIMELNAVLYEQLLEQAKDNPRLRQAFDLRANSEENSQRMLNALIPGTEVPIHRHTKTIETAIILLGDIDEIFYDANGNELDRFHLLVGDGIQVPVGVFHTIEVHSPSILLEVKDGKYAPLSAEDRIYNNC